MTTHELRQAYLRFFEERGHAIVPSASLVPDNDPTTLFTGSGMQPMVPYLLGEPHPLGTRIADSQKCFRSQDIEEVGDNRHTTFFEMLGNWSLGDYFKREQISWMFAFLTERVGLDPARLYVTVFRGSPARGIPRDEESVGYWQAAFATASIDAKAVDFPERDGMGEGRIFYYDERKNWWSRAGVPENMPVGEPGGPDTEMFWDFGPERELHQASVWKDEPCHVNCDCGRFLEIGNNVFMEYVRASDGFAKLPQQNVDFGGGLERLAAALADDPDVFCIDAFDGPRAVVESLSRLKYGKHAEHTRTFRIILDHLRAAVFLIGDGVFPSNKDQGYFVRRLIRRAVRCAAKLGIQEPVGASVGEAVVETYAVAYPSLSEGRARIAAELSQEEEKFRRSLEKGEREFEKMLAVSERVTGEQAFVLYTTYGFPLELTEEMVQEKGYAIDKEAFQAEFRKHQELSRSGSEQKFAGGLADHSAETTRLHTATHLLNQALRAVLGPHVFQRGSNITRERLRFDFSHPEKLTSEQLAAVEDWVNDIIRRDLPVHYEILGLDEAKARGAIGVFDDKYAQLGDKIKVYFVGDVAAGTYASSEVCGGPHVERTGELGGFKIAKEEAVAAGIRRIKAVLVSIA
ncbi:alanine--tRNA ligase [Candidatus Uhrbacteria bacterium]|nr:alanine--tRNA ligase [Candidatus Uhrbacteria bacterium]